MKKADFGFDDEGGGGGSADIAGQGSKEWLAQGANHLAFTIAASTFSCRA
jgi:hypothetical protein